MSERISGFIPEKTKIALTTVYPMSRFGGVPTVVRSLAEDYREMGFNATTHSSDNKLLGIDSGDSKPLGWTVPLQIFGTSACFALPDIRQHSEVLNATVMHGHESTLNAQELMMYMVRRLHPESRRMVNIGTLHALNKQGGNYLKTFSAIAYLFDKLKIMDAMTVVSEPLKRRNEEYFPFLENIDFQVVPNGVDTKIFNPKGDTITEFDDGKVNIVYVGRLEERKGVHHALDAVAEAKKTTPNIRFIIGGNGPQRTELEYQAENLELSDDVVFLGEVPEEIKPSLLRTADFGLYLSTKNESFGIVLLEAMATGIPVIAGDNEGYNTLITENDAGRNGFTVNPSNVQETASRISLLAEDTYHRREMGKFARTFAEGFDRKVVAGMYLDVYSNAHDKRQRMSG